MSKFVDLNNKRHEALDTRDEFRTHVSDQVYHGLESAGNLCRLRCQPDPDLLDSVADGIWRFLCDGDIFDYVMVTLFRDHPDYVGHIMANLEPEVSRRIIAFVLGETEAE